MITVLNENEMIEISGGGALDDYWKEVEDAGQWVRGFFHGLWYGSCPTSCK